MFLGLKRVTNTTRLSLKFRPARAYQRSRWCEWQMSGVSCATVLVVIRSKCKAQRWRTSSSCLNIISPVPAIIFLFLSRFLFFFSLAVQTLSFRVSRDGIARPEQKEPIPLSRAEFDKLIGIKVDKRRGAAPSDIRWRILCRCIRSRKKSGRWLERVGRRHADGPGDWAPIDRLENHEIINTVSIRSSTHTDIACWNIGWTLLSRDDTLLEKPMQIRRSRWQV